MREASAWASYNSTPSASRDGENDRVAHSSEAYSAGDAHDSDDSLRPRQRHRVEPAVGTHQLARRPRRRRRPDPPRFDFVSDHEAERQRIAQQRLERDERARVRDMRRQQRQLEQRRLERLQQQELLEQQRIQRQQVIENRRRQAANLAREPVIRMTRDMLGLRGGDFSRNAAMRALNPQLRGAINRLLCMAHPRQERPTTDCPICMEPLQDGDQVFETFICRRAFHGDRLRGWWGTTEGYQCPVCRETTDINLQ